MSLENPSERTTRGITDLLTDQIEFADVILLNKADCISREKVGEIKKIIYSLNTGAELIETKHCRVPLSTVLNTGRFDFERASNNPMWLRQLRGEEIPETEEYGISSLTYRRRKPFHPQRFWDFLNTYRSNIIRAKGFFWIATRKDLIIEFSQSGKIRNVSPAGVWWADSSIKPQDPEVEEYLNDNWDHIWGDRRQELVFIGTYLDGKELSNELDKCLLTDEELNLEISVLDTMVDPFPKWDDLHLHEVRE